jgi:hypothetical protein
MTITLKLNCLYIAGGKTSAISSLFNDCKCGRYKYEGRRIMIPLSFNCQQSQPSLAESLPRAVAIVTPRVGYWREPRSLPLAVPIRREL